MSVYSLAFGVRRVFGAILVAGAATQSSAAQTPQQAKRPVAPPPPAYAFPPIHSKTLPNGLAVQIVENRALPLVAVRVVIDGGSLLDPAGQDGLFTLDTLVLRDGTTSKNGDQLSQALDELGTPFDAPEAFRRFSPTRFTTVTGEFAQSLALMGDMLMHPSFPADAVDRRKAAIVSALQRAEGTPATVALRIFNARVFGEAHPFARVTTSLTLRGITRDDIARFHDANVGPQNVTLVVVGDVSADSALQAVAKVFGAWKRTGQRAVVSIPIAATAEPTTIYLYNRPGSPQSTVFVGQAGPVRGSQDAYALELMGALFGGGNGSRLTASLRERRALTYGVVHTPVWRGPADPSSIFGSSNVDAVKTDSALLVWMGELKDIAGPRPPTDQEVVFARSTIVGSLASRLETIDAMANRLSLAVRDRLPAEYNTEFVRHVNAVTTAQVVEATKRTIVPSKTTIVVVGDRTVIEPGLRAANIAPIVLVDENGKRIP
ncbi:MAG TPA: pitrilysin family protein [Gemmatimonadaceae bacterium]|nr:pitrilysin family protein [Gemmatimonadaceae bacterium]